MRLSTLVSIIYRYNGFVSKPWNELSVYKNRQQSDYGIDFGK